RKLPNVLLGWLSAIGQLVDVGGILDRFLVRLFKLSDPGVLADVVGVRGLHDVLCDRLSVTQAKLRGKRVGYLDAVRVKNTVTVRVPRQRTVSIRGVSHF